MSESIELSAIIPASPAQIFHDWLDSAGHTAMTGSPARCTAVPGQEFSAWDGYISGKNVELEADHRIRQAWRTTEFPEQSPDSILDVFLEAVSAGTRITIKHSQIPDSQGQSYAEGWEDFYFKPMQAYYQGLA